MTATTTKKAVWKRVGRIAAAVVVLAFTFLLGLAVSGEYAFQLPFHKVGEEGSDGGKGLAKRSPLEFLLLDTARVDSYLAQLTNGTSAKQRLSQKVVKSAGGGLSLEGVGKVEASSQEENFVEREVTPTAASRLIELENKLGNLIEDEKLLHHFRTSLDGEPDDESEKGKLEDGDMVRFRATVRGPAYVDPYLTVTHAATVPALFPQASWDPKGRAVVEARREAAKKFRRQVGEDPRAVLAIRPSQKLGPRNVNLLMPVHMKQLSEERSLLRTGGVFTVFGKVVRIFSPQPAARLRRNRKYSYVDTPTWQTWLHPIRNATGELVCRANLTCATSVEASGGATGSLRHKASARARRSMIRALRREIRIGGAGGMLIIPLAIYR